MRGKNKGETYVWSVRLNRIVCREVEVQVEMLHVRLDEPRTSQEDTYQAIKKLLGSERAAKGTEGVI